MLEEALDQVAPIIVELVKAYKATLEKTSLRKYYYKVLMLMIRELEFFVTPAVSVKAQNQADNLGIGDLARFQWDDQTTKMNDPKQKIFHFEHMKPVGDIFKELMGLEPVDVSRVHTILLQTKIAWITKDEDQRLRRVGRIEPIDEYKRAGIDLIAAPSSPSNPR
jgi:hypothetical protein